MSNLRWGSLPTGLGLIAAASLACAAETPGPSRPVPNVRPFFALGTSYPVAYPGYGHGLGVSFGLEAEQSPRASVLFRVDYSGPAPLFFLPYPYTPLMDWGLGVRVHARPASGFRPYAEGGLGIRVGGKAGPYADTDGLTATLRLGIAAGHRGGAGAFLDSGLNFLVGDPRHYGIAPIRFGLAFP